MDNLEDFYMGDSPKEFLLLLYMLLVPLSILPQEDPSTFHLSLHIGFFLSWEELQE